MSSHAIYPGDEENHHRSVSRSQQRSAREESPSSRYEPSYNGYGGASITSSNQQHSSRGGARVEEEGVVTVPIISGRRRRIVCAATLDDGEVSKFYVAPPDYNPFRSTVCMDQHVLARMEDDLRRAEVRKINPESAMPDRGELYEQELEICLESRTPVLSARRSLAATPRSAKRSAAPLHLPPISPQSGVSRSHSRSRRSSACTTPSSQPRRLTYQRLQQQQRQQRAEDEAGWSQADDGTSDFIRREKERDIRRRLMKSQEEDPLRRPHYSSPRESNDESDRPQRSERAKPRTSPRKQLVYDEVDANGCADDSMLVR